MKLVPLALAAAASIAGLLFAPTAPAAQIQAGALAVDISPPEFPVRVNGNFLEKEVSQTFDPLFARAVVLDDGNTRLALCVVDTCMMPRELIDEAKALAARDAGIPTEHMLVCATHTHSAPSAMACLGSRVDPKYAAFLPRKIAEAIVGASQRLVPAQIASGNIPAWRFTNCRRWIRRPDKQITDPFGVVSARANMHPGHVNPDAIAPSGPIDPDLSILSIQTLEGKPLALLANFSMHYFGAGPLSADYFGKFASQIGSWIGANDPAFVGIMSQGTSGDSQWRDYSQATQQTTIQGYTEGLLELTSQLYFQLRHEPQASLAMAETTLRLHRRVADPQRQAWARETVAKQGDRLPKTLPEIYANEQLLLAAEPERELKLQALRLGDLAITAIPNEVYAITGLKLKTRSPLPKTFNIELANGSEGYIPPPEQHVLGGYTTWAARTAGLETEAEPRIVDSLLTLLETVSQKPNRSLPESHGPYAQAILKAEPMAYWRLDEIQPPEARDATGHGHHARYAWQKGVAFHLLGVGQGLGASSQPSFTCTTFSGPGHVNRSPHFAGGSLEATLPALGKESTLSLWFWNGLDPQARPITGTLYQRGADALQITGSARQPGRLLFVSGSVELLGKRPLLLKDWHHLALIRRTNSVAIYLDGQLELEGRALAPEATQLQFAGGTDPGTSFEGKLDEIAIFSRALSTTEAASHYSLSGPPPRALQPIATAPPPTQSTATPTQSAAKSTEPRLNPQLSAAQESALEALKPVARLRSSQGLEARAPAPNYSASFWFRNDFPNQQRSVTAYLFSRGPLGNSQAPGEHLGIGGTFQPGYAGRLLVYNGNDANQTLLGKTVLPPGTWHHIALLREGSSVAVYLDGSLEVSGDLPTTAPDERTISLGERIDRFAPLQGQLGAFALFSRLLSQNEIQSLVALGHPLDPTTTAQSSPKTDSPPLTPELALQKIHVSPSLKVELAAAEPLLLDPVAFDWDLQGRLWVVEMADYPLGLDNQGRSGGRIRILEDTDGDGRYDRSQIFAEGLNFPNGILTWRDGVLITAAPHILFLRDTDGDGRADEQHVLITGLQEGNQQLRANGLRWGLDNWVYVAAGGHHGKHGVDTRLFSSKTGIETLVGSRDFRFQPDSGQLEPQSGPTQFGRNRDNWGHWFGSQNSNPLWHYVLADPYLRRNPWVGIAETRVQLLSQPNPPVFPASTPEKRFHGFDQSGRFTSACSGVPLRDPSLFPDTEPSGLICEPFHNLIQRVRLKPEGLSYAASRVPGEGNYDFFASEDRWCRPVMVREGPDGSLWVADMYRYMIEHPQWLPPNGKDELLPHYRAGEDCGRLYRISPKSASRFEFPATRFQTTTTQVAALESPNGWVRDKAQQALLWARDPQALPALRQLASQSPSPLARLHALWTLDGLGESTSSALLQALRNPQPGLRENALQIAEHHFTPELLEAALPLASDPDPKVRLQLAFSLGESSDPRAGETLALLWKNHPQEPLLRAAILSSALPHLQTLAKAALPDALQPLLLTALGSKNREVLAELISKILPQPKSPPSLKSLEELAALLEALTRANQTLAQLQSGAPQDRLASLLRPWDQIRENIVSFARNPAAEPAARIHALSVLGRLPETRSESLRLLEAWLAPKHELPLQTAALRALGETGSADVPSILAKAWPAFGPGARMAALGVWLSREAWISDFLERLQRREIQISLDPLQVARLTRHESQRIRSAATQLFGETSKRARDKIVGDYSKALSLPPNPARGQSIYQRICSACHKRGNEGRDIGPDLASVAQHPPEKLLRAILDPNADIQPGYTGYTCTLTSGEQLFGLVTSETSNSVTLKLPDASVRTVTRSEIQSLQSQNLSLMPEGLEAGINPQEMADLIGFLRSELR